jgi:hypothetical protein
LAGFFMRRGRRDDPSDIILLFLLTSVSAKCMVAIADVFSHDISRLGERNGGRIPACDDHVNPTTAERQAVTIAVAQRKAARDAGQSAIASALGVDAMNRRMMTYAAIGAAAVLSVPAWAQTTDPGTAQASSQSNLATYGTASPVVAGAGNVSGSAAGAAAGGVGVPAGAAGTDGAQFGVSSTGPAMAGGSGVSAGLTTTTGNGIATPPMAGNTSAQANAGTTGTAALTGTTLPCASTSAAVGVLSVQMPSDCLP